MSSLALALVVPSEPGSPRSPRTTPRLPTVDVAVRHSRGGKERVWPHTLFLEGCDDGLADAARLVRAFATATFGIGSPRGSSSPGRATGTSATAGVQLRMVPARATGAQAEVRPVQGQGLAAFLERACREDGGVYQLRAVFDAPLGEGFVHVNVAFPDASASAGEGGENVATVTEQFECAKSATVADLKRMMEARTQFPAARGVLLQEGRRLPDHQPLERVAANAQASGMPLHYHLATGGAYVFLRREGQGHCEPSGPYSLALQLPACVRGARTRSMQFNPEQRLGDLRWSIQGTSGLPPAGMRLTLRASPAPPRTFGIQDLDETLEALGFVDGCALRVERHLSEENMQGESLFDIPLEVPLAGPADGVYQLAAAELGLADALTLALFAGSAAVDASKDVSALQLADGVVLAAHVARALQLSVSLLSRRSASLGTSSASSSTASGTEPVSAWASLDCMSSDTIAQVRQRAIGANASRVELAGPLRSSKVFALDIAEWTAAAEECHSLAALARLLGHFWPCGDGQRLSRLGITEAAHLVFVPEQPLMISIELRLGGVPLGERRLRSVSSTLQLRELRRLLEQDLRARPLGQGSDSNLEQMHCQWLVPKEGQELASPAGATSSRRAAEPAHHARGPAAPAAAAEVQAEPATPPAQTMMAKLGSAVAAALEVMTKGKRRSLGGGGGGGSSGLLGQLEEPSPKRRRTEPLLEVSEDEFVGDLHTQHPVKPQELPDQLRCPILLSVMRDPVIVAGSGNTYDRESIEQHFRLGRHSDPLTNQELRPAGHRRLIPNNVLRSQINEAESAQVNLRLVASYGKRRRSSFGSSSGQCDDGGSTSTPYWVRWMFSRRAGGPPCIRVDDALATSFRP